MKIKRSDLIGKKGIGLEFESFPMEQLNEEKLNTINEKLANIIITSKISGENRNEKSE